MGKNQKNYRKGRPNGRKLISSFFLAVLLAICLSCASKPLPDQGVTILSPKANDVVKAGDSYEILWKAEPAESEFGTKVTVEFSKDGGKSWEAVEFNVPTGGKYVWTVPKIDSPQCKVRVYSQYRPKYRGTSEQFSVK